MLEDGALPHEVDAAMRDFGFPMGVFQMADLAGLDIGWAMRKRQAATRDPSERYVEIADRICEIGRLGRKTGRGWYDYSEDKTGAPDPWVTALIEAESARKGITRQAFDAGAIMARILSVMQDEGEAILAEGIAASPEAIDVVMINGFGFPRWRGGPMFMKARAVTGRTDPIDWTDAFDNSSYVPGSDALGRSLVGAGRGMARPSRGAGRDSALPTARSRGTRFDLFRPDRARRRASSFSSMAATGSGWTGAISPISLRARGRGAGPWRCRATRSPPRRGCRGSWPRWRRPSRQRRSGSPGRCALSGIRRAVISSRAWPAIAPLCPTLSPAGSNVSCRSAASMTCAHCCCRS
jgi:hypothetical protein